MKNLTGHFMHFTKHFVHYMHQDSKNFTTESILTLTVNTLYLIFTYMWLVFVPVYLLNEVMDNFNPSVPIDIVTMNLNPEHKSIAHLCRDSHSESKWH